MPTTLAKRPWLPEPADERITSTLDALTVQDAAGIEQWLQDLIEDNQRIHDQTCVNLNPATNRMNPRAEQMLAARLGSRPSLGYPGEKYEMGLEAIEQIEIIAAELAARVFHADYAEVRVGSGALANLFAFMACCEPGDVIVAPPAMSPHRCAASNSTFAPMASAISRMAGTGCGVRFRLPPIVISLGRAAWASSARASTSTV